MKKKIIFYVICVFVSLSIYAQNSWKTYTISNSGLASNGVNYINIDTQGNKWIATTKGINRFDGTNWTTYNQQNTSNGLPNDNVNYIKVDKLNNVWISANGFDGTGITKFNGTNWNNFQYPNSSDQHVSSFCFDLNDNIWVGTLYNGICKFDGNNWTQYNNNISNGYISNTIGKVIIDSVGNIWGLSNQGFAMFDGTNWTNFYSTNSGYPNTTFQDFAIDSKGVLWFAGGDGLYKYEGSKWTAFNTKNSGLSDDKVWNITIDSKNNKWISTNYGLCKFDGINWTIFNTNNSGIAGDIISGVTIDSDDNKWIITNNGISFFNYECITPKPTISEPGNVSFCDGGFLNLTSSTGNNYKYQWYNNGIAIAQATSNICKVTTTGSYTVKFIDGACNSISDAISITVYPLPNVALNDLGSIIYKSGNSIQLVGNPTGGKFIGEGVTGSTFNPTNAKLGLKTITYNYTSPQGCSGSASQNTILVDSVGNVCNVTNTITKYDTIKTTLADTVSVLKIKVQLTTGIKANQLTSLSVYPNPTSDMLIIDAVDVKALSNYRYLILDLQGKEVYNSLVTNTKIEISLKTIGAKGTYIFHVVDGNGNSINQNKVIFE